MSQLQGILTRLKSLQEQAKESESAQRFFEIDGVKKCQVTYFSKTEMFELEVYSDKGKSSKYQFDNVDMITIEIFDLLQS
ncbi:YkuJ family protein [Peribacillus sp. NPDC097264]|uniref:YkuJ family protein n=1 Tax=unclassified Peribacillus TaxID=2675266 RepID=UPI003815C218